MKLYGSNPSPYTRRLRIWLNQMTIEYCEVDIYGQADREKLVGRNPTLKIPMLIDKNRVVLDSGLIHQYLVDKMSLKPLSISRKNLLLMIDSVSDSLVNMFLLEKSHIDITQDKLYFNLQRERINNIFSVLEKRTQEGMFDDWDYAAIALFCLLDWSDFRQRFDFSTFTHLCKFWKANQHRKAVVDTDPRN